MLSSLSRWAEQDGKPTWVAIGGKAYDITEFLCEHPGGEEVIMECTGPFDSRLRWLRYAIFVVRANIGSHFAGATCCPSGKDATADFYDVGHSDVAISMMAGKNDSGIKIVGTIEGEVPESMKSRSPDDEVQFAWRSDKDLDCMCCTFDFLLPTGESADPPTQEGRRQVAVKHGQRWSTDDTRAELRNRVRRGHDGRLELRVFFLGSDSSHVFTEGVCEPPYPDVGAPEIRDGRGK